MFPDDFTNPCWERLPLESRGRMAINPSNFESFFAPRYLAFREWPYAALFEDEKNGSLVWSFFCSASDISDFKSGSLDLWFGRKAQRPMKCVEVHERTGEHHFLKEEEKTYKRDCLVAR